MLFRVIPSGDVDIQNGQLVLLSGLAYARQKLSTRFKFFLGEWFLDQRDGIPYFRSVFVQNPDMRVVRSVFRQVALSIKGNDGNPIVSSLPKFDVLFTPVARKLAFDFSAILDSGELLTVPPTDDAFIIALPR